MSKINSAVILAAGMGSRICEITNDAIPKGFIEINGKTLVDRSISKLRKCGIRKIYIVTGHLSNFYNEMAKCESDIYVKYNKDYKDTGSMSSLAILENDINEDFLLLEGDLIYEEKALNSVINYSKKDCILLSGMTNSGDECYVEIKDENLYKVSKNKEKIKTIYGELVGISKISLELYKEMLKEFNNSSIKQYHYEYAIFDVAKRKKVGYIKENNLIWGEIDDKYHLKRVKDYIIPRLNKIGEE
ncbi:hypothetical protein UT300005_22580 [Clostridium sp. CTA-5]